MTDDMRKHFFSRKTRDHSFQMFQTRLGERFLVYFSSFHSPLYFSRVSNVIMYPAHVPHTILILSLSNFVELRCMDTAWFKNCMHPNHIRRTRIFSSSTRDTRSIYDYWCARWLNEFQRSKSPYLFFFSSMIYSKK